MEIDNDKEGAAILQATDLLPGETANGTVSITNVGDADGDFTLTASNLRTRHPGPGFSTVLTLVVTRRHREVYNDLLSDISDRRPRDLGGR